MATYTPAVTGTTAAVFIPSIWTSKVNEFFRANLVAANFFTDLSSEIVAGGKVVYVPNTTELSASTKSAETTVTLQAPTDTKTTLTVATHKEASFMLEDSTRAYIARSYNYQERYAKSAAYAIAKAYDAAIIALFSGFTNSVGASNAAVADSDIRLAISKLGDTPAEETAFFFHTFTFWTQIAGIDRFSSTLYVNEKVVAEGEIGKLYGRPVYVTSQIAYVSSTTGRVNCLAHKDAIVHATQNLGGADGMGVRVQANYMPEYLGELVTADAIYGAAENRDGAGVIIYSSAS